MSPWSKVSTFTAYPPATVGVPILLTPGVAVGGSVPAPDTLQPMFTWNAVSGAASYRFQLSRHADLSSPVVNVTETHPSHAVPLWAALTRGTQYWWRVQASSSAATSAWSTVFTFTTPSQPGAPALTTPATGIALATPRPTFGWAGIPAATSYQIQIATNSWFGMKVVDQMVSAQTFTPSTSLAVGGYYWRVRAINAAGSSAWAPSRSFSVGP